MKSTELALLRRAAAKQTTLLTHYGRKTGPYEVTIWFVLDGDRLYIGTANVNRQWVATCRRRRGSDCPSLERASTALLVSSPTVPSTNATAAIRRKYWMFRPIIGLGRLLAALTSSALPSLTASPLHPPEPGHATVIENQPPWQPRHFRVAPTLGFQP